MTSTPPPGRGTGRDLPWIAAATLCTLLAVASVVAWFDGSGSAYAPEAAKSTRPPVISPSAMLATPDVRTDPRPPAPVSHAADPIHLRIPRIDVDTAVGPLSLDPDGRLPAPESSIDVGWWREGPSPGEAGPAVIVGHLDTETGPAVFAGLTELRPGDRIEVIRADNSTTAFTVRSTAQFPQNDFPTKNVYGPTQDAELRLITCGGTYDRDAGRYLDNTVVYATVSSS
ncbi:class F sortase [Streptomyces sp. NPDC001661]